MPSRVPQPQSMSWFIYACFEGNYKPVSTLAVTLETSTLELLTRGALTGGPGVRLFWGRWPGFAILLTGANIPVNRDYVKYIYSAL